MSHALGEVIHNKTVVGYFEYNGTVDIAKRDIHSSADAVDRNWRKPCTHNCTCKQPPVDVVLWSSYGGGFHWNAKACLNCGEITDGLMPDFCDYNGISHVEDGYPC